MFPSFLHDWMHHFSLVCFLVVVYFVDFVRSDLIPPSVIYALSRSVSCVSFFLCRARPLFSYRLHRVTTFAICCLSPPPPLFIFSLFNSATELLCIGLIEFLPFHPSFCSGDFLSFSLSPRYVPSCRMNGYTFLQGTKREKEC